MMPVLDNQRHERFAQAVAQGKTASAAYEAAGYKPNEGNASRLNGNEKVAARVRELQSATADLACLDRSWVLTRLMANADRCLGQEEARDPAAANRALELLGKELGLFVERTENVNLNHVVTDEPLTDAEWEAEHATSH